jgi:hypothetical protein
MAALVGSIVADYLNGKELKYQYTLDLESYNLFVFNS